MNNDQTQHKPDIEGVSEAVQTSVRLTIPFPKSFTYTNASALSMTAMDLRIGFAEAMPDQTVEPRVGVCLTIEHAAYLAVNLVNQLIDFENNFGTIRNPAWISFLKNSQKTSS